MSAWWEQFFEGVALTLWRRIATEEEAREDADFLIKRLALVAGFEVLDVPCGNGRHLRALAQRGIAGVGVDLSREFIAEAKQHANRPAVEIQRREMRDLPWRNRFDAALCLGNSFGYLDESGNREFLEAVARTLKPGARLALQTAVLAECCLAQGVQPSTHEIGSLLVESVPAYDAERSLLHVEYTFILDGQPDEVRCAEYRVYTLEALCELLSATGFTDIEVNGDREGTPFAQGHDEAWVIARWKPAPSP